METCRLSRSLTRSLALFRSAPVSISFACNRSTLVAHFCCTYIVMCTCVYASFIEGRPFGSFCNICRKTSLECRLPCFYVSQIKYYTPKQPHTHTHTCARQHVLRIPNFRMDELQHHRQREQTLQHDIYSIWF